MQNARLAVLQRQYRAALRVLERHVRAIYEADSPDLISFAVGATSFGELINNLELLDRIGKQDQRIAGSFDAARVGSRARTRLDAPRPPGGRSVGVSDRCAHRCSAGGARPRRLAAGCARRRREREGARLSTAPARIARRSSQRPRRSPPRARRWLRGSRRRSAQQPRRRHVCVGVDRRPAAAVTGSDALLARLRAGHERLRPPLGQDARGHRHRRRDGNTGARRCRGNGDLRRMARRLRESRRGRPRRRAFDRVRPQLELRRRRGRNGRPPGRSSRSRGTRATRPGRTCTSRSA